ncbi:MAG: peptidylprolyl isomerase [Acidobacteriia bacterium]|nr:peptidylprolyl isomerase [Terriglobia bacterium]
MFQKLVLFMVAILPSAIAADISPNVRVVEEIAAKVNGDIITRGELAEKRKEIEAYLKSNGLTGAKLAEAVKQQEADSLRDEIDTLLLVQKGKDLNINVDGDVTRYFAEIQVESKISDPDKFHEWLRQQSGMTYEELRDRKRKELLARRVVSQEIGSRITIPEADLQKYYEEHKAEFVRQDQVFLSQIIISTEGKTPEQVAAAEKKAKDLVARARKGEKFGDLARENSDEVESAKNGGYAGAYKRGLLMKPIEDVVFKEKKGFITDPIKTPTALAIFKIEDRYEAGQASFEEVKDDIQGRLAEPKMTPKVREFLTRLRQEAFLEIKDSYLDSGAAPGKDTHWHDVAQLKPPTTTKEEVAAHSTQRKKLLFIPIPGTHKKGKGGSDTTPPAAPAPPPATPIKQ